MTLNMHDQQTFEEMLNYLRGVKNCRVNGLGWHIIDLSVFLNKVVPQVEQVPKELRKSNVNCTVIKRTMQKVVEAHKKGNIEKAGTIHKPSKFQTIK